MSNHSGPSPTIHTSIVRNTVERGKEQALENPGGSVFNAALREYYDKHYHQLLPLIAEKVHQEKVQQEKLKEIKARLNFEESLRHSESGASSKKKDLRRKLEARCAHNTSESSEPRRDRLVSPRKRGQERNTVFQRLEKERQKAIIKVRVQEEHNSPPEGTATKGHLHERIKSCQEVRIAGEDIRNQDQRSACHA
ncbi:hypothetical protein Tco_0727397 [Tanacetum coccineum]|uniref:Reverse transcriptase domain-containing protein n=1 Tax=Tanacetum coccineum TaxID=301880 RepID=A0ABQ4YJA2_9ASTR